MAGRPRRTARELNKLEDDIHQIEARISELIPARFVRDEAGKCGDTEDDIGQWWHDLQDSIENATRAIGIVAEHYRFKAGVFEAVLTENEPAAPPKSSASGRKRGRAMPAPETSCPA